jgi:hypothetical protein
VTTRTQPWSIERVLGLASDPASARAGEGLARAVKWRSAGTSPRAVWGLCQGSRAAPYQVVVDLDGPAFRCSCPSRKVPCKHVIGLLLLWSARAVPEQTDEPDWATAWLEERASRASRTKPGDSAEPGSESDTGSDSGPDAARVVDPVAAERRAARRAERVAAGLAELESWLDDQIRHGLAGLEQRGYAELNRLAARMVDAQAPGVAGAIRRAAGVIGSGPTWPGELLEELAMIHLTVAAHRRLPDLPAPLAETVRARIGWTVPIARVMAEGERVEDDWLMLGRIVEMDERLTTRRVWLTGRRTGRRALLLAFAPAGQQLDPLPTRPGGVFGATLAYYPGSVALRALLIPEPEPETRAPARPDGQTVGGVLSSYAELLALDPWLERWPVVLSGVRPARSGDRWALVDESCDGVELWRGLDPWPLLSVSAGEPVMVAGEWSRYGFRPMTCWDGDRPVKLS